MWPQPGCGCGLVGAHVCYRKTVPGSALGIKHGHLRKARAGSDVDLVGFRGRRPPIHEIQRRLVALSVAGTALLRARYSQTGVPEGVTWLFEIVLPEDRVAVDYGDRRDLVRLSAIYIATGRDVDLWRVAGP